MTEQEREPKEQKSVMSFSRRGFLKGLGTGAVSVAVTGVPMIVAPDAEAAAPSGAKEAVIQLTVNKQAYRLKVKSHWTLLEVLRKELGLTGAKQFCDRGSCGACTVIMEGKSIYACSRLAIEADIKKASRPLKDYRTEKISIPFRRPSSSMTAFSAGFAHRASLCP